MAHITITIDTDNAAFGEMITEHHEVADILREAAHLMESQEEYPRILRDHNGNTVGHVTVR